VIKAPPEWGIEPAPDRLKILRGLDLFVLWFSLGVGLLVYAAGAELLELGLSLADSIFVSVLGSVVGVAPLAVVGLMGGRYGVPTMVLTRPALGVRGSWIPTVLNVVQLVGWASFELWVMATALDAVVSSVFGYSNYTLWVCLFALWCGLMALGGPLMVVRKYLERFAIYPLMGAAAWITYYFCTSYDVKSLLGRLGAGGLGILLGIDLVVAMPISWLPLVADYNRFARDRRGNVLGTYLGYLSSNVWFYAMGAICMAATMGMFENPVLALTGMAFGAPSIIAILVDETDNCFADIYSCAMSAKNVVPEWRTWKLVVAATVASVLIALFTTPTVYVLFLYWIGSVFCPLAGIMIADHYLVKRGYRVEWLYGREGYWYTGGFNPAALACWAAGIASYWLCYFKAPFVGSSIPSMLVSMLLYAVIGRTYEHTIKRSESTQASKPL